LAPAPHVRVVMIDGLSATAARELPGWTALCARGLAFGVDVGFPTVSLPVEVALWTGLTQQQTGVVFRSERPLDPPLDRRGIPAQVPESRAVAESYGYIVRSLGFAHAEPPAHPERPAKDLDPEAWRATWQARAHEVVASDTRLAFVHVLRVDTAGHRHGHDSDAYRQAAREADEIVRALVAAAPDARWFLLSDHGHLPRGGHGGEERAIRQVEGCIVGPGVAPGRGGLLHVVDVARAIADSVGARLDPRAPGRPLAAALAAPLAADQAVPATDLGRGALAIFVLVAGLLATAWGARSPRGDGGRDARWSWWLGPWWFVAAFGLFVVLRGEPTLSMPMVYRGDGEELYTAWLGALPLAALATWFGLGRTSLPRVLAAQLALPLATLGATLTACGAWPSLLGAELAPVVPHYTAYASPLLLVMAHGSAAVALGVLVRTVQRVFDRSSPPGTPRSAP
jgi:hypothetical protein